MLISSLSLVDGKDAAKLWSRPSNKNMDLLHRTVHALENLCAVKATVAAGCPQNGLLSALCTMVSSANDLLYKLGVMDFCS